MTSAASRLLDWYLQLPCQTAPEGLAIDFVRYFQSSARVSHTGSANIRMA